MLRFDEKKITQYHWRGCINITCFTKWCTCDDCPSTWEFFFSTKLYDRGWTGCCTCGSCRSVMTLLGKMFCLSNWVGERLQDDWMQLGLSWKVVFWNPPRNFLWFNDHGDCKNVLGISFQDVHSRNRKSLVHIQKSKLRYQNIRLEIMFCLTNNNVWILPPILAYY